MMPSNDVHSEELIDEIGGFVLWTDASPGSNEPTELEYYLKGFDEKIWERFSKEIGELISTHTANAVREARLDEQKRTFIGRLEPKAEILFEIDGIGHPSMNQSDRIQSLKEGKE